MNSAKTAQVDEVTWSQRDALAYADKHLEEWYQSVLDTAREEDLRTIFVSTEIQVLRLRVGVKEGDLLPFTFNIGHDSYEVNLDGKFDSDRYPHHPNFNISDQLIKRILR